MRPSDELDALLERSDPDSADWSDGGGHERANAFLLAFSDEEWDVLRTLAARRGRRWRAGLAASLAPRQGATARQLLVELASDPDTETAFIAAMSIAFHCGISDGPAGPFIDHTTRDSAMVHDARAAPDVANALRRLAKDCDPRFQRRFELLLGVLSRSSGE